MCNTAHIYAPTLLLCWLLCGIYDSRKAELLPKANTAMAGSSTQHLESRLNTGLCMHVCFRHVCGKRGLRRLTEHCSTGLCGTWCPCGEQLQQGVSALVCCSCRMKGHMHILSAVPWGIIAWHAVFGIYERARCKPVLALCQWKTGGVPGATHHTCVLVMSVNTIGILQRSCVLR